MTLDHEAIYKAYSGTVVSIVDSLGAFDKDNNLVSIDDSLVTKARTELDEQAAKVKYKTDRQPLYPPLGDFADAMYWNSKGDSTKLEAYYAACEKVKTDNPKPS
tara:strand:- start:863 stop:1174 length:312 start_codon:yes stop_codon:yes gene_type:complete